MNEDEKFTNRHGHTISALKESVDNLPEPEYKTTPVKQVRRRKRRSLRLSGRQLKILLIVIAIIVLVPVLVGEYVRATYGGNISSAKSTISQLFKSVIADQKNPVTSEKLTAVDTQLSTVRDGLCAGGFFDNLAKLYPRSRQAYEDCATYRSSVAALEALVNTAAAQMAYLEQVQPLLEGVAKSPEEQFAVLGAQQENWQTFVDGLQQLSVPASFHSAHADLVKQASAVRDDWIALVQATNTQDDDAFRDARAKLTQNYTAFRAQATGFSTAIAETQTALSSATANLR